MSIHNNSVALGLLGALAVSFILLVGPLINTGATQLLLLRGTAPITVTNSDTISLDPCPVGEGLVYRAGGWTCEPVGADISALRFRKVTITAAQMKSAGPVEILPVPTSGHSYIILHSYLTIPTAFTNTQDGTVSLAWGNTPQDVTASWSVGTGSTAPEAILSGQLDTRPLVFKGDPAITGTGSDQNILRIVYIQEDANGVLVAG